MRKYGFAVLLALALNILPAKPQTTLPPYEFSVPANTTLANCVVVPNYTTWCWTGDGHRYMSLNGAAFVLDNTAVGVTSWNGLTGAVTYTPAAPLVTSVNGKTGAVTISAVATAPAVTLQ